MSHLPESHAHHAQLMAQIGPEAWRSLHRWAQDFKAKVGGSCGCGEFAVRLARFDHDLVNAQLGKPLHDVDNFNAMAQVVGESLVSSSQGPDPWGSRCRDAEGQWTEKGFTNRGVKQDMDLETETFYQWRAKIKRMPIGTEIDSVGWIHRKVEIDLWEIARPGGEVTNTRDGETIAGLLWKRRQGLLSPPLIIRYPARGGVYEQRTEEQVNKCVLELLDEYDEIKAEREETAALIYAGRLTAEKGLAIIKKLGEREDRVFKETASLVPSKKRRGPRRPGMSQKPICTPAQRARLERCIREVKSRTNHEAANPWAVCTASIGCRRGSRMSIGQEIVAGPVEAKIRGRDIQPLYRLVRRNRQWVIQADFQGYKDYTGEPQRGWIDFDVLGQVATKTAYAKWNRLVVGAGVPDAQMSSLADVLLPAIASGFAGTIGAIGASRLLTPKVVTVPTVVTSPEATIRVIDDRPHLLDEKKSNVYNPKIVAGDQAEVDLGTLLEEIDQILKSPDKMGEVDTRTLRVVREGA